MKFKIILSLIASFILVLSSCKSSKGHCDAYGNKSSYTNDDIDKQSMESDKKYITVTVIK